MGNNLRLISKILYKLKRQYGRKVILYRPIESSNSIQTGKIVKSYTPYVIKRVALLPARMTREIAADKNFTQGAFFDRNSRWMIIDQKDLPKNFKLQREDKIKYENDYYVVNEFFDAEDNRGYLVRTTSLESIPEITRLRINLSSDIEVIGGVQND